VPQVVTSTNAYGVQSDENGVDLSESTYETATSFNQAKWLYDLQRQDNVYDALGRLLYQTKDGSTSATIKITKRMLKRQASDNKSTAGATSSRIPMPMITPPNMNTMFLTKS